MPAFYYLIYFAFQRQLLNMGREHRTIPMASCADHKWNMWHSGKQWPAAKRRCKYLLLTPMSRKQFIFLLVMLFVCCSQIHIAGLFTAPSWLGLSQAGWCTTLSKETLSLFLKVGCILQLGLLEGQSEHILSFIDVVFVNKTGNFTHLSLIVHEELSKGGLLRCLSVFYFCLLDFYTRVASVGK